MGLPDSSTDSIREVESAAPPGAGPAKQSQENAIREGEPPLKSHPPGRPEVRRFLTPHRLLVGAIVVVAALVAWFLAQPDRSGDLELHHRYLLVEAVGPSDWVKKHTFSVRWQGKDYPLPVVFRFNVVGENFEMGSGDLGHLNIGNDSAPISAKPDTEFQVRNTGITAFISEKGSKGNTVAFSVATSVAISPPKHPADLSPIAKKGERDSAGKKLETRIKQVIASGSVLDVQPDK